LIRWDEIARALKDIDYSHHCVIETFNPDTKACPIVELGRILRRRAATQDDLTRDGLAFLKTALRGESVFLG